MMIASRRTRERRDAFTLIEILVAIGIIAGLMSLAYTAVSGYSDSAREAATATTMIKLQKLIQQRVEGMDRWIDQQQKLGDRGRHEALITRAQFEINTRLNIPPQAGVSRKVAELLVRKEYVRSILPQGRRDVSGMMVGPSTRSAYNLRWAQMIQEQRGQMTPAALNAESAITDVAQLNADSAELLYFSITGAEVFGIPPVDAADFDESEVGDTDEDGLLEFIDAWGNPIRFYRWPTALFNQPLNPDGTVNPDGSIHNAPYRLSQGGAAELLVSGLPGPHPLGPSGFWPQDLLYRDPDDAMGRLTGARLDYPPFAVQIYNATRYHMPDTYHVPLLVSMGRDEELGLEEPYQGNGLAAPVDVGAVEDNVTNRNRRAGD